MSQRLYSHHELHWRRQIGIHLWGSNDPSLGLKYKWPGLQRGQGRALYRYEAQAGALIKVLCPLAYLDPGTFLQLAGELGAEADIQGCGGAPLR